MGETERFIRRFWELAAAQDREGLRGCFWPDAVVCWHCSNELFTVEEYIRANCEYPGEWKGEVERFERTGPVAVTAARIWTDGASFHVCSFFALENQKIRRLDEYWGDDGDAPAWRRELRIGRPVHG